MDELERTVSEQVFGDMSEQFEFDEDALDYMDGPLSGWLKRKSDGAWFAFDCQPMIIGKLWHWTLVPASKKSPELARVLSDAARSSSGSWLSITEDRRAKETSICRLVRIENIDARPVLASLLARPAGK